jgi:hypothetical protein
MKKFLASALMVMFATSALAAETAYVLQPLRVGAGQEYVDPCPTDGPVPANGLCGDGRVCPMGYEPVTKMCWDGGFRECGITCKNMHLWDGGN